MSLSKPQEKVMYWGWDNYIKIISTDTTVRYKLNAFHSSIYADKSIRNLFRVRNTRIGNDTIQLLKDGQVILEKVFDVRPKKREQGAYLLSPEEKSLSRAQLQHVQKLHCPKPFSILFPCRIVRFTIVIIPSADTKGALRVYKNPSAKILPETLRIIKTLKKGARIFFEDIQIQGPDNELRKLMGFDIIII